MPLVTGPGAGPSSPVPDDLTPSAFARLFALTPQGAADYLAGRDRLTPTFDWRELWQGEHAEQFTVSRLARLDLLAAIQEGITQSVGGDLTRRDFSRNITKLLQDAGWWGTVEVTDPGTGAVLETRFDPARVKLIYDMNTRMAHSAGRWDRIQGAKRTHPYLRYITKDDARVRDGHAAWHNLTLAVDDPWWQTHYPPNGWRCRCRVTSLTQAQYDAGKSPTGDPLKKVAPPSETVGWLDKRTGEIHQVPIGIDPGFAYNVGEARARVAARERLKDAKLAGAPAPLAMAARQAGLVKAPRVYPDAVAVEAFAATAWIERRVERKLPVGRLTNRAAIEQALGRSVDVDEVILQASYLGHVADYHGVGGIRQDPNPVLAADLALAVQVINADPSPTFTGEQNHGNPLVKFVQEIGGITYKVIGEIRAGKKNRNIAVFNIYKR